MSQIDSEIRAAKDARRILDDPVFQKAFRDIESTLIERMKAVPLGDIDTQHELVVTLQLLGNLKKQFTTAVDTGKMAEIQKESLLKKVSRVIRNT